MKLKTLIKKKLLTLCALMGGMIQAYCQPVSVAPVPTLPQGQVICEYNSSGIYTNVVVDNYYDVWYGFTPGSLTTTNGTVLGYLQMLCCGSIDTIVNPINVSGCTNLHVDVFTPQGNCFRIRLVDKTGQTADYDFAPGNTAISNNAWMDLNVPLSAFRTANPSLNLGLIQQVGWIDNDAGSVTPADYYIDNVYFGAATNLVYTPPPAIPTPTNNAATPTRPAQGVLAMYNGVGNYPLWPGSAGVNWDAAWSGSPESSFLITNTANSVLYLPGLSYVGVEFYNPNQIDTTGFSALHFDVWALNSQQLGVQLVSLNPTVGPQVNVSISATQQWVGIDIPLSAFTATNSALVLNDIQQLLWVDNASAGPGLQNGTYYIDNVYFWTTNQVKASIGLGKNISWTNTVGDNYQPQKSANGSTWVNLGGLVTGSSVNSVFDPSPVPYYQVEQISPGGTQVLLDGGFETAAANAIGAANWNIDADTSGAYIWVTNQYAGSINPHGGSAMLYMESTTPATGPVTPPSTDVRSDLTPVTAGLTYNVSFYAQNPVQVGGANPQWDVFYYDNNNNAVGGPTFTSFSSVGSAWTQVTGAITPPAGATQMTIGWVQAMGAGNGWDWVTLIDDVSVTSVGTPATNTIPVTVSPGVGVTWKSIPGNTYSVQSSPTLTSSPWPALGGTVLGTGTNTVPDVVRTNSFYRVMEDY